MGAVVSSSHVVSAAPSSSRFAPALVWVPSTGCSPSGAGCSHVGPPWGQKSCQQTCLGVGSLLHGATGPARRTLLKYVIPDVLSPLLMGSTVASLSWSWLALALSGTEEASSSFPQKPPLQPPQLPKPCYANPVHSGRWRLCAVVPLLQHGWHRGCSSLQGFSFRIAPYLQKMPYPVLKIYVLMKY